MTDRRNFRSDNEAPAHPAILEALVAANRGLASAYAEDEWSRRLDAAFSELFATECRVLPLATGTAANSILLAAMCPPWGAVLCHKAAHIHNDEGGAPEFYTDGAKLIALDGENGRLDPAHLAEVIDGTGVHGVHNVKPAALSLTQATECGTCYRPEQIRALADVAGQRGLAVHMDGARFANAVAFLDCHPADITWRAGVDALSFGLTKNGAIAAEAMVVFDPDRWQEALNRRRKRGGHLLSKMRFVSAQLLAMLENDLWLELAGHANAQARALADGIRASDRAQLKWPCEANEVFIQAEPAVLDALAEQGFGFHRWPGYRDVGRLVTSFATTLDGVGEFLEALEHA